MKLSELQPRIVARITGFTLDQTDCCCHRLRELGFCEGSSVEFLRSIPFGGPRVYRIASAVFSIDADMAHQVLIETHAA